jgi:hypothetical protein
VCSILTGLALVTAVPAASQTYTFGSCQNSVSLTVSIKTVVSQSGPFPDGQGGHSTNLIFMGDFILTAGGSTQTYASVIGTGTIGYTPTIGNLTTFLIQIAPGGPIALQATMQGAGDLIPNGQFSATLPPLSSWTAPSLGMQHDYIAFGNPTKFYLMDSFNNCTSGGGPDARRPVITSVISAGAFGGFSAIAPGTWIEIYGTDLAPDARQWGSSDFNGPNAPTSLDGVQVTINGQKGFIMYISPGQINAQVPANLTFPGSFPVVVNNNGATSEPYNVTVNGVEPGLLAPSQIGRDHRALWHRIRVSAAPVDSGSINPAEQPADLTPADHVRADARGGHLPGLGAWLPWAVPVQCGCAVRARQQSGPSDVQSGWNGWHTNTVYCRTPVGRKPSPAIAGRTSCRVDGNRRDFTDPFRANELPRPRPPRASCWQQPKA